MTFGDAILKTIDNRGKNPPYYLTSGIPVIDNYMIQNEMYVNLAIANRFLDTNLFNNFLRGKIDKDCVLLTTVGNGIGNVSMAPNNQCAIIQNTLGYFFNFDFDQHFMFHLLQSKHKQLLFLDRGMAQPSLKQCDINSMIICVPNLEEQQKISNFLDLINNRIETQNKIIEKLESLKIGIKERIYLFGKEKESFTKILHEKTEKSTIQNQYPVLSSTVKGLFLQSEYFDRSVASENNIGYKIVKKGQIIISPQNLWMGNLTINEKYDNGIVSPSYKIYEIDKAYSKKYIFWLLTSKRSFFNYSLVSEQGASIVRRNLNLDAFMELYLPVTRDVNTQQKIEKLIDSIEKKVDAEKKRGALLNKQKTFLLGNLFI